jgi:hypothetical protein
VRLCTSFSTVRRSSFAALLCSLGLYTFQSYSTPSQSRRTLLEGFVFKGTALFLFLLALHWQLLTTAMSAVWWSGLPKSASSS